MFIQLPFDTTSISETTNCQSNPQTTMIHPIITRRKSRANPNLHHDHFGHHKGTLDWAKIHEKCPKVTTLGCCNERRTSMSLSQQHMNASSWTKKFNCCWPRWVLWTKYKEDKNIDHFKARLVAKRFIQILGIDYGETFSQLIKVTTIKLTLSIFVITNWQII